MQGAPELNGVKGRLVRFDPNKLRWQVELGDGHSAKAVKPQNLKLLVPEPS